MIGRAVRAVLFLAAGLVCALALIDRLLPFDYDPDLRAKFEYFKAHKDDYTTLAIGTSRFYREIIPPRLDASLRAAGVDTRTFNMALPGMEVLEAHFLLQRVAELRPRRLRYLLVSTDLFPGRPDDLQSDPFDTRNVYWRTPGETVRDIVQHFGDGKSPRLFLLMARRALILALYRVTQKGRLALLLTPPGEDDARFKRQLDERQGYFPLEEETFPALIGHHQEFLRDPGRFQTLLLTFRGPFRPPFDSAQQAGLQDIVELTRRDGWKIVFIRTPLEPPSSVTDCQARGSDCAEIGFEDRRKYAEFFLYSSYYDYLHLNRRVAGDLTDAVARRLLALPGFLRPS